MMEFLKRPDIKKMVEEYGDMDFITPIMEGVMKNPMLMLKAMKVLGKGILF
jgi:hypothetical protein